MITLSFLQIGNYTYLVSGTGIKLRSLSPHSFLKRISEKSFLNSLPVKHTGVRRLQKNGNRTER
ncbi:MAG TPA: hypothetical protein VJZ93_04320, partial [Candidatus Nanoarchaeia archaeon]|nr:hypothetical protein [Candidatus Nanoarchaeia archaeon]